MQSIARLTAIVFTVGFLAACDSENLLVCTRLENAITTLQPSHVTHNSNKIDDAYFEKSLKLTLRRHSVQPPDLKKRRTSNVDKCAGTMTLIRDRDNEVRREDIAVEILGYYAKQLDPHSGAFTQESLLDVPANHDFGLTTAWTDDGRNLVITDVIVNSPAHKAKLSPGMIIRSINRTSPHELKDDGIAALLSGTKQDKVILRVEAREVTLVQARYVVPPFETNSGRIGVIRVRHLAGGSDAFATALDSVEESAALVLDLRNISGGKIEQAAEIANGLVPDGGPFVGFLKAHNEGGDLETLTLKPGSMWDGPIVVLVNSQTRSAAEVLAAALQDYGAIVIGSQTFGKGTRQEDRLLSPFHLPGTLELTTAFTIRPSGLPIQLAGVTPDVELPPAAKAEIVRLEKTLVGALPAPAVQKPLSNYDMSTLPFRSLGFRERLQAKSAALRALIERNALGASRPEQEEAAALSLASFLVNETRSDRKKSGPGY